MQIDLNTISMTGSLILSHDSMVMRVGPGVDTQFSHGSDTSTERFKMTKPLHKNLPLFLVQVDSLCCTLSIQIKERTVKMSLSFGESWHFWNFAISVSPRD